MSITERVNNDIKDAMRAKQAERLSVLRGLKAALMNAAIEKAGGPQGVLADPEAAAVVRKQLKQRQDSIESFEKGGRIEQAMKERGEIAYLQPYLPRALSESELDELINDAVREAGATGKAHLGAVMKVLQPKVAGRVDGKTLKDEVQKRLA